MKLSGVQFMILPPPEEVENLEKRRKKLEGKESVENKIERKIIDLKGEEKHVLVHSIYTFYQGQNAIQTVLYDLTEKERQQERIKSSLKEKETLLKEIHHRVKNNLAVVSGLIEMQVMTADQDAVVETLKDSQQRIHSMAMIHEKLYQSEALDDIGFDAYVKELVDSISRTYKTDARNIDIEYDLEPVALDLDQAIPCSLIINEVIVNSFKHAFDDNEDAKIRVGSSLKDSELAITIIDNGRGIPEDFDISNQQSLGMTLIQTLAQQLKASTNFSNHGNGTTFELRFEMITSNRM